MKQMDCYWYISESLRPWEAAVVGTLARALLREGAGVRAFSGGGTESLGIPGILSWHSLNATERALIVGTKGKLWHLWGAPPSWWKFIRFRSRTIHTRFDSSTAWKGHPTVLSATVCSSGETYIPPAFEVKMSWSAEEGKETFEEAQSPLFLLAGGKEDESFVFAESAAALSSLLRALDDAPDEEIKLLASGNCILVLPRPAPSLALLAAFAALMGVPSVAARSALMDEALGKDGYVHLTSENPEHVRTAFRSALGEGGRSASAYARRSVTDSFPPEKGAKKLKNLYLSLGGGEK